MRRVVIESPYAGDVAANVAYARACVVDCLRRGEAPYASHLFFTQEGVLDDDLPHERQLGIDAGLAWARAADHAVLYVDRGISCGMVVGLTRHIESGLVTYARSLEYPDTMGILVWPRTTDGQGLGTLDFRFGETIESNDPWRRMILDRLAAYGRGRP